MDGLVCLVDVACIARPCAGCGVDVFSVVDYCDV